MAFIENILLDLFLFFFPVLVIYSKESKFTWEKAFSELGLKKPVFRETMKQAVVITACLVIASFAIASIATLAGINDLELVGEEIDRSIEASPAILVYLVVFRVFTEEFFFRGFLTPRIGIFWSSVLFGAGHLLFGSLVEVIGAFLLGMVLAWFYRKNRNLFPNIIAHMLYNLFALVFFFGI